MQTVATKRDQISSLIRTFLCKLKSSGAATETFAYTKPGVLQQNGGKPVVPNKKADLTSGAKFKVCQCVHLFPFMNADK
jgi:hypothetical protein